MWPFKKRVKECIPPNFETGKYYYFTNRGGFTIIYLCTGEDVQLIKDWKGIVTYDKPKWLLEKSKYSLGWGKNAAPWYELTPEMKVEYL